MDAGTVQAKRLRGREIVGDQLGWDITDFGSGAFARRGLALFAIRNGRPANVRSPQGKTYAERIMIVEAGQLTPPHFHWQKTEDIPNRSGGRRMPHTFRAEDGRVLVGEVSVVNDDRHANRFHETAGRFPEVQEDEATLHSLTMDCAKYYRQRAV